VCTSQRSASVAISRGSTPADTSEDFPEPEGPTTSRKFCCRTRRLMSSLSWSRPKNRPASSGPKASSPGYGQGSDSAGGGARWSSCRSRATSVSHRDRTVQSSRTRKSRRSGRSYASSSTGTSRSEFRLKVSCVASSSARADHWLISKARDKTRAVSRAVSTARSSSWTTAAPGRKSCGVMTDCGSRPSSGSRNPCTHSASLSAYATNSSGRACTPVRLSTVNLFIAYRADTGTRGWRTRPGQPCHSQHHGRSAAKRVDTDTLEPEHR